MRLTRDSVPWTFGGSNGSMVKPFLSDLLVSPKTAAPLAVRTSTAGGGRLVTEQSEADKSLEEAASEEYPIRGGICRFVDDQTFVESFGFQWNRFDVRQLGEDEETFELKTGVPLSSLSGKLVLDAGCGGGRYSRVCAEHGAKVVAVDRSQAVEKTWQLTQHLGNVEIVQADLTNLPFKPESFDLVFSIGVIHHSPDTRKAFASIAQMVKPGGRLSVWVYRRNTLPQELLNDLARMIARAMPRRLLLKLCQVGAWLGAIPVLKQTLNKVLNFSNHPNPENRVCDNFDWYSPEYQHHHTPKEVKQWFEDAGFEEIRELPPAKKGKLYSAAFHAGLIIGSGVNMTGVKKVARST